jgi:acyl-CoA dehydrogenase
MASLQPAPSLGDAWTSDRPLREALNWHLGDELYREALPQLSEMGRAATAAETLELARRAESEPPVHTPYAPWGERVDDISVSPSWLELGRLGIEAGVTALPYEEGPFGERARLVGAGLLALWGPSSALYSCPVAMADGAARTLLVSGTSDDLPVVERLTTRDWSRAWTSGQWMTETTGGSDVGRTETVARLDPKGNWRLHGVKWFASATNAEVALTLARPEGAPAGSLGLALFLVRRELPGGEPNRIVVRRMKDKLGTRALPTAELELTGAVATPVGDAEPGSGVRRIATMLNITRVHNSIAAAAAIGRGLAWARAYAESRVVFGRSLKSMPAHRSTLTDLAVDYAAALALALRCSELIGVLERRGATEREWAVLRALVPATKLATGRWSIAAVTEAMEAVGGVGYCEDSTIPALVRNTHVIPIWEGTTNVLSLDVLRAAKVDGIRALLGDARAQVHNLVEDRLIGDAARTVIEACDALELHTAGILDDGVRGEARARSLAMGLASTYACARLCAQGVWASTRGSHLSALAASRLAQRGLLGPGAPTELALAMDSETAPAREPR